MKNHNLKAIVAIILALPFLLTMCKKDPDENLPTEPVKIDLNTTQTSLITSGNAFAFDIFRKVLENESSGKNIMISPLSISYALSMTLNGANGDTRDSMLKALRVDGITPEEINSSYKILTDALINVDKRVTMSIANSVWTEINFAVKKAFIDILINYYNAESKQFDINDQTVPDKINTWISDKTNGLINNMMDQLDPRTVMMLINAIYFKGKWKSEFDVDKTATGSFYKAEGSPVSVPMMKQSSNFKIYSGDGFVMGEFPYGQGNFVMDVILPNSQNGISNLLPGITETSFNNWAANLNEQSIDLTMPHFKYDYKIGLKNILSDMGMGIAFDFTKADFTNIADGLYIGDVLHDTFIETNEEGTKAAAATVVTIIATVAHPEPPAFDMDHPFIYIIRETTTGSIVFMGKVADPSAS